MIRNITLLLIFNVLLASCSTRIIDFTLLSRHDIDLSRLAKLQKQDTAITQTIETDIIVFITLEEINANIAFDQVISSIPGAVALLNGDITHNWYWIPYIYGETGYVITGTALVDPNLVENNTPLGRYALGAIDNEGKLQITSVSYNEFHQAKNQLR